jgi:hypothetical protein
MDLWGFAHWDRASFYLHGYMAILRGNSFFGEYWRWNMHDRQPQLWFSGIAYNLHNECGLHRQAVSLLYLWRLSWRNLFFQDFAVLRLLRRHGESQQFGADDLLRRFRLRLCFSNMQLGLID